MFTDFGVTYGYSFEITEKTPEDVYAASLQNTSPTGQIQEHLIDQLAFNMDAVLGTDFTIESSNPDWTLKAGSGDIQFDYVCESDTPVDRLALMVPLALTLILLQDSSPLSKAPLTSGLRPKALWGPES
jgi:hypothetical protein